MKIKALITGATGMVGEGVLLECLNHPDVDSILVVNRRPCGYSHPKLTEIIHHDFHDLSSIKDQLSGFNAAFFCLGASSVGMNEAEYRHVTYDLTLHVAEVLAKLNPQMTFCYVSGTGTDSSEKGRSMWARVKGQTENDLLKLPFKAAFMFRPGYIHPARGQKNIPRLYKVMAPLYPLWKTVMPKYVCTMEQLARVMISVVSDPPETKILESRNITTMNKGT